jgi:hypothetical protein
MVWGRFHWSAHVTISGQFVILKAAVPRYQKNEERREFEL